MTDVRRDVARNVAMLGATLFLLALADVVVLEHVIKPTVAKHRIPWSDLEVTLPGGGRCLPWHLGFAPLGIGFFVLLGVAARSWKLAVAGVALFATGWEDAAYYLLLREPIPSELAWLDPQPFIAWTRVLTRSEHVTRWGLVASMMVGLIAASLLLRPRAPDREPPSTPRCARAAAAAARPRGARRSARAAAPFPS